MSTTDSRNFRAIIRCMLAQLRNGNESLAHGPNNTVENIFVTDFETFAVRCGFEIYETIEG